jgi:hypothetical protein
MNRKYQKPYSRNLGDTLPGAQGECFFGSIAKATSGENCSTGHIARGSFCYTGSFASGTGCYAGLDPAGDGCSEGFRAGLPGGCHAGVTPS